MALRNLFLFLIPIICFTSCLEDDCTSTREYRIYNPVNLHVNDFRVEDISVISGRVLENPGKLYFYQNMLLINEQGRGIHFYDISDRSNVTEVAFYDIPGNFDMAINNNVLYADNVIDLISIDISDVETPRIIHREENYRDEYEPDNQTYHAYSIASNRVEIVDCSDQNFGQDNFWRGGVFFATNETAFDRTVIPANAKSGSQSNSGIGGSFARFTIENNHLYTVTNQKLISWATNSGSIKKVGTRDLGWGIETIFPYRNHLFIGSNAGMFIFDNSNPASPVQLAVFEHARACDPVVVNETHAYVTLRNGSECQGFVNQMDVVDITNLKSPKLVKSYPMEHPHGLSIFQDRAFLCEGVHGLKILDISNPGDVKEVDFIKDIKTYDVIALNNAEVFIVGEDGFYLAEYHKGELKINSSIKAEQ